jgi:cysteine sulfinate desulfinase/cysteine desulfurase-like protein
VLTAIGVSRELAGAALRVSFGCLNDDSCVGRAVGVLATLVEKARGSSPALAHA